MIDKKLAAREAQVYLFELGNCAREFGFQADEGWALSAVSGADKTSIEKRYHPVMSVKVFPEILSQLFNLVSGSLSQAGSGITNSIQGQAQSAELQYLVAYNPKRPIR